MGANVHLSGMKALHDLLIEQKPPGVAHHCSVCDIKTEEEPQMAPEDDAARTAAIAAAVDAATATLHARIAELEAAAADAAADQAVTDAVAAAIAPLNDQIATLQSDLDAAVAAKVAAERQLSDTMTFLETEAATAAAEANRELRVEAVRETGIFDDAHLEANSERWAAMEDADWETTLAEYKAIATRNGTTPPSTPPPPVQRQPLKATADTSKEERPSAARAAIRLRRPRANTASVLA